MRISYLSAIALELFSARMTLERFKIFRAGTFSRAIAELWGRHFAQLNFKIRWLIVFDMQVGIHIAIPFLVLWPPTIKVYFQLKLKRSFLKKLGNAPRSFFVNCCQLDANPVNAKSQYKASPQRDDDQEATRHASVGSRTC